MKILWNWFFLLLLWIVSCVKAQSSFYKRDFYQPISSVQTHRHYQNSNGFVPLPYARDSVPQESKRKSATSKKYAKRTPDRPHRLSEEDEYSNERYNSNEYSSESQGYGSQEQDSREYTIGTQIRVQHPITLPKKLTSTFAKSQKYTSTRPLKTFSDINLSSELHGDTLHAPAPPLPPIPASASLSSSSSKKSATKYLKLYEPDPFHIIAPPKSTSPAVSASNYGYNVYEPDLEDLELSSYKAHRESLKSIAAKKQLEHYLKEQQKKLLDEALKIQLLNNPEFKRFLKAKEKELLENEREHYEDISSLDGGPPYRQHFDENLTFTTSRPSTSNSHHRHRRPHGGDLKRSPSKRKPITKPKRKFRSAFIIDA